MSENSKKTSKIKSLFKRILNEIKSLKFHVFIVQYIVGMLPVLIIGEIVMIPIEDNMVKVKQDRLLGQCNILKNHIASENYLDLHDSVAIDAELSQLSAMYDGRIKLINRDYLIVKDTYVMDEGKTTVSKNVLNCFKGKNISKYDKESNSIRIVLVINNDNKEHIGVMEVSFSTNDVQFALERIEGKVHMVQFIVAIILLIFTIFWSSHVVKPFNEMEMVFDKVNEGYMEERLDIKGYSETEKFAEAFNGMMDRMKKIDDSRQEFVSNVSHELKTPITSIKVLADSLMMQEDVPNEIYKEFFADIVTEIDRENKIITDLLSLVRLDKKTSNMVVSEVNINEMVELILKRLRPIAAKNNIELVLESFRPIVAEVDEVKINSAVTNLIENAVKYNVMDGWVRVTLNADHKYFFIKVADSGIGIPQEAQEMIFDRFYRVDKTRARQTGGTGLGLAITKNIILLHNGAIKVYSKEGEGTTFTVRIPLNYVADDRQAGWNGES